MGLVEGAPVKTESLEAMMRTDSDDHYITSPAAFFTILIDKSCIQKSRRWLDME